MPRRSAGQEAERRVIKKIGAVPQPASGAFPGMPHDGIKGKYLIEVKSTVKQSIGMKLEWLTDLGNNALMRDKVPALIVVFEELLYASESKVKTRVMEQWVLVPLSDFEKITDRWKK